MLSISSRGLHDVDGNIIPGEPFPLWEPLHNFYFDSRLRLKTHTRPAPVMEMTRIAIGLRLWLRRAIKRINDRTTARIVDMVNYNSLRALYGR